MKEEKEIKLKLLNNPKLDEVKSKIESLFNTKFEESKEQEDLYFDRKDNFYFDLAQGIRIRNNSILTHKAIFYVPQRINHPWFILEKELELPITKNDFASFLKSINISPSSFSIPESIDIDSLNNLLEKSGLYKQIKIKKKRLIARTQKFDIFLDEVENLGIFLEVEAKEVSSLKEFQEKVTFKNEIIRDGYTYLYAKKVLNIQIPNFDLFFKRDPEWNYIGDQKEIVDKLIFE